MLWPPTAGEGPHCFRDIRTSCDFSVGFNCACEADRGRTEKYGVLIRLEGFLGTREFG
jgi:hypothetical protein